LEFVKIEMKKKAIIVSIKGHVLTKKEILLLSKEKPWGLILFKRNIKNLSQTQSLIKKIKKCTKDKNFPILIDQEGETVSRLRNIINHDISADYFGNLYLIDKSLSIILYKTYLNSLCKNLKKIGININTIPVLDVLRKNTNKVLNKRCFSNKQEIVKKFGKVTISQCRLNKIISIIKHIPGHGCATSDSHYKMPKVNLNNKELNRIDFYPFKSNSAKLAMTAHVLYKKIDPYNVATFSKKIIEEIVRKKIGFRGILMSDDISMKALKFDLITNAKKSLEAGCNLVLYCAGNISDNFKLIKTVPYIDNFTAKKTSEIYKILR
jgi:beta-N-acetylhexosaminidase